MPPSRIADTWSPEELRQAEALARLEGWGQERRRTAALQAELHNVSRIEQWFRAIDPKRPLPPPPKLVSENEFLPKRLKRRSIDPAKVEAKKERAMQNLSSVMNGLCGYR